MVGLSEAGLNALKEAVGPEGFLEAPADTDRYCVSWRDDWHGATPLVLRPGSTEQVAACVQACAKHKIPIVPQSGQTGLTGGSQPHEHGQEVVINLERMTRIRDIDLQNETMTVDGGVVLQTIQQTASDNNRLFPLSLGAEGSCRIAGNISTNAGGIQVLRYGTTRDLVLGLEVVLPDGRVWNGLKGLRKDNTGYDLKHLFIGGEGTLGIITGAVLKLFPKPTENQYAVCALPSATASVELLAHLRARLGDVITSFELMQRICYDIAIHHKPETRDPFGEVHPWYALIHVANQGQPGDLNEPLMEAIAAAMEGGLVKDAVIAASDVQAASLFAPREALAEVQKMEGASIKHDVSVPLSAIPEFLERSDTAILAAYPDIRPLAFGHVGDGNLHYNPMQPVGMDRAAFLAERDAINLIVHDIVCDLNGSISAEHGIGRLRVGEIARYKSDVELDLARSIKAAIDPDNIMNPGKMLPAA